MTFSCCRLDEALNRYQQLIQLTIKIPDSYRNDDFLNISILLLEAAKDDKRGFFAREILLALRRGNYFLLTYLGKQKALQTTQTKLLFEQWGIIFMLLPDKEFELLGNIFWAKANNFERVPVLNVLSIKSYPYRDGNNFNLRHIGSG